MRRFGIEVVLAAFVLCATTGARSESVKLEYKFKKDDVTKYNIAMELNAKLPNIPGMPNQGLMTVKMSMLQAQRVTDVYPDGTAKIKVWSGNMKMSMPGMPAMPDDAVPATTMYMKMSKLGRVLAVDLPEPPAPAKKTGKKTKKSGAGPKAAMPALPAIPGMPGMDMNQMISQYSQYGAFPAEAVEVGTPWIQDVPLPLNLGTISITNTVTSAGEQFAGAQTAKLTKVFQGHIDLTDLMKMFSAAFAAGYNNAAGKTGKAEIGMPDISGTVDFVGSSADYFSTELGKLMGTTAAGTATINLKLPPELAQNEVPADMSIVIDGSMTMTKI